MINQKIRACIFIHYSTVNTIPYYVELYISQLANHFDKIKVLTNNLNINQENIFFKENVEFVHFKNQGYDFGMFYNYIKNENLDDFSQLGIVNDSNILLNKLNPVFHWGNNEEHDFWGIIDSHEKPWFSSHDSNYHVQSHFLVLNENAIKELPSFFESMDIVKILNETDLKKLRRMVIDQWEIGLTQYLIKQGLIPGSFISSLKMHIKYQPKKQNLTHSIYHELASEGYPLLKKKVALEKKSIFKNTKEKWKKTIHEFGYHRWDTTKIVDSIHEI